MVRYRTTALCAAAFLLAGCAPEATAPTASPIDTPGLVAPTLSALAPGSPLAQLPDATTPTPSDTETPITSPLPDTVDGYTAYRKAPVEGGVQVFYAKAPDHAQIMSAAVMASNKTDAQLQTVFPNTQRVGRAWCAPDPDDPKMNDCVVKVGTDRAVLALGTNIAIAELGPLTTHLADAL